MNGKFFNTMQKLGKTFMLPIALLPLAGLFLGLGATITGETFVTQYGLEAILGEGALLNGVLSVLTDVGDVIFGNLALLFAVSVAMGLAEARKEVAALSAVVGYFVMYASMTSTLANFGDVEALKGIAGLVADVLGFSDTLNPGVFGGIIIGLAVAYLHNKFYKVKFPDALSFFAGTHFVPIISTVAGLVIGALLAFIWPYVGASIAWLGEAIAGSGPIGSFFYGYVYRALIPFGLHHVFYLPFWQTAMGGSMEVAGEVVNGAQNIVFAQLGAGEVIAPAAAKYFSFAFPMMLCGFPAAALAMYHTAKKERKKEVKGLLLSSSITSFLTGITEPIEFSILFASPLLYFGVNAVLAGLSVIIVELLNIGVGFTFSAGFLDFALYGMLPGNDRTNWIPLLLLSLAWGVLYYVLFRFCIVKFDLKTPGREDDEEETSLHSKDEYRQAHGIGTTTAVAADGHELSEDDLRSQQITAGLGGRENISDYTNCATRLRVTVKDGEKVNQSQLRKTGAAAAVVSGTSVQVVYGTKVGGITTDLEDYLQKVESGTITETTVADTTPAVEETAVVQPTIAVNAELVGTTVASPISGRLIPLTEISDPAFATGALGQGIAIDPTEGIVLSPVSGTVTMIFPTYHAVGITSDEGIEVLIHIGMDTVSLEGKGFEAFVKQDDKVELGEKLVSFDIDIIKEAGLSVETPVIITNSDDYTHIEVVNTDTVSAGDELMTLNK